jgi:hypothetical protein
MSCVVMLRLRELVNAEVVPLVSCSSGEPIHRVPVRVKQ